MIFLAGRAGDTLILLAGRAGDTLIILAGRAGVLWNKTKKSSAKIYEDRGVAALYKVARVSL